MVDLDGGTAGIGGFHDWGLPPMQFMPAVFLIATPILVASAFFLIKHCRNMRFSTWAGKAAFGITSALALLSGFIPMTRLLTDRLTIGYSHLYDWSLVDLTWAFTLSAMIGAGAFGYRKLGSLTAACLAIYYVAFPIVYTLKRGHWVLGPGPREIIFVIAAFMLLKSNLLLAKGHSRYRTGRVLFLALVISVMLASHLQSIGRPEL